jgi:hypothetical protein
MANPNSVPSDLSHHIWRDDAAQRDGLEADDPAALFDSLLTADDRKFLWAMWIDFRHTSTDA